jgi:hypothetical protein
MIQGVFYHGYDFFRFYKDGTFIHCLIRVDNPDDAVLRQILQWFELGHSMVTSGKYKSSNGQIEFTIKTMFAANGIDYKGKAGGKKIVFETLNHTSGQKSKATYTQVMVSK